MSESISLIVGLGNPGSKYEGTRHNAGFLFLERVCELWPATLATNKHCHGRVGQSIIDGIEVRLLAPDTFMNLSGKAVVAATSWFKVPMAQLLVVHDELDLDPGAVRLKFGGGHGGNNGLRDIIAMTGSNDFHRIRVGVGHPGTGRDVAGYLLRKPGEDDRISIDNAIEQALGVLPQTVHGDIAGAMQTLHTNEKRTTRNGI
jgi:PTH1 family peptidyl-tRNA hydrolase